MILLHGTTRQRAEAILRDGPNPRYHEPGGLTTEDGFSMSLESGPFHFGTPEKYARGKAKEYPDEGEPVILVVDVPDEIVQKAVDELLPLSQGVVQFNTGAGYEELLAAWPSLIKGIRSLA